MVILGNFLVAIARVADIVLLAMYWLLLIRALISWVSPDPHNPIVQFLYRTTEPLLIPIRRFMPQTMRIDLSVLVAFLIIVFMKEFLVQTLYHYGMQFRMM